MDWNNNGKLDVEDLILTEIILDEEDEEEKKPEKPNGSCLTSMFLFIAGPLGLIILAGLTTYAH